MNTRNENQAEEHQPLQPRWYCLSANGMATLALDENDARNVALESDQLYPRNGPHQAVQMVPVQPDGRGTDAQILKERDIARCAIVGALAAGHAGQPHPGADHWLAAAHDAGVTIASLERADRPVGGWQGDAFQSMEHPFSPHTGDAAEAAMADLDKACCKPLPNAASAALAQGAQADTLCFELSAMLGCPPSDTDVVACVSSLLALRPQAVPMTPELTDAMLIAGLKECEPLGELIDWREGFGRDEMRAVWDAMLAAAQAKGA